MAATHISEVEVTLLTLKV